MFKRYYTDRFREVFGTQLEPDDGFGDEAVRAALARVGHIIPASLFDYYSLAGRHWINENHNRLRPIEELDWMDDKLIFMEENQGVVFWGIQRADLAAADPFVLQGVIGDPIEWYTEDDRLSWFVMEMWNWTMTGESGSPEPKQGEA